MTRTATRDEPVTVDVLVRQAKVGMKVLSFGISCRACGHEELPAGGRGNEGLSRAAAERQKGEVLDLAARHAHACPERPNRDGWSIGVDRIVPGG